MKTKYLVLSIILLVSFQNISAQKKKLYGSWQASNGAITTFISTKMTMAGTTYRYKVIGNIIRVYDEANNTLDYKYQVKGKQLYLYVEGYGTYVLQKVSSSRNTGYSQSNNNYGNQGNTADNARLYGSFCTYSSSGYGGVSSYSTTKRITFDGHGHYTYGSQSSYSGGGDGYYGGDGGYSGTYKVIGNKGVIITSSDGSQYRVAIHYMLNSGEITELRYDGVVYGKSICD